LGQKIELTQELGYLRVGAAVPALRVADVDFNVKAIVEMVIRARDQGVQIVVFPEMAITGYTLGDLVQHQTLLAKAEKGLGEVVKASAGLPIGIIVGMPLSVEQKIFNSAVIINNSNILGVVPKTFLPNYKEFYDERWFESGGNVRGGVIQLVGQQVPFGTDLLFKIKQLPSALFGVEICEDLWVPFAPHEFPGRRHWWSFNLSASNEVLGKPDWRRTMVTSESGRCWQATATYRAALGNLLTI
jgi:NAD+ synthase (glutamine-hydrolysing)